MSMPHQPYIAAVVAALTAADLEPTRWWASDGEIDPRGDGATTMDNAVLVWQGDHPEVDDEYPDGLLFAWESSADAWQWAELHEDGSNDELEPLDLPLDAAPERVVEAARAVLSGETPAGVAR
jgi:hypothetical protein